jgi:alkylation response protein AidB-like acyl-CoA dehydrogenase
MNMQNTALAMNEDLQAFSDLAKEFSDRELIEKREENDRYPFSELYHGSIKNAGEVGFFGVNLPAEYGGVGMDNTALAGILETISLADASFAGIILTNAAAIEIVMQASIHSDCAGIFKLLSGKDVRMVSFHSFTGLGEIEIPEIDKSGAITGRINFLTLGSISHYAVIPARASGDKISYYLMDLNESGVEKSEPVFSIGFHACPAVDVFLDKVPGVLIGRAGEGEKYFHAMQSQLSIGAAAISLGIMKGSFMEALQYTKDRFQGGRQIINWSEVRMLLANMAIEAQIGQNCLSWACLEQGNGSVGWEKAARATAIHVAEMACRATVDGVQLLGGNGYMKDYGQEKRMRDAKQAQCFLGMAPVRKIDLIDQIIRESE